MKLVTGSSPGRSEQESRPDGHPEAGERSAGARASLDARLTERQRRLTLRHEVTSAEQASLLRTIERHAAEEELEQLARQMLELPVSMLRLLERADTAQRSELALLANYWSQLRRTAR